jgi:DNA recombination protein RmuC
MTIPLDLILYALAGLILGFLGGWFVSSGRTRQAVALAVAESEARINQELASAVEARTRLDATLQAERQSGAESSRQFEERILELQARLLAHEKDIRAATADLMALRGREGQLAAELAKEREGFQDRLASYQDAEQRLEKAFKALSAATLDANAARFLELAAAKFETLKGDAQHDLTERQQNITAVLDPMRSALQKVEQTLEAVESSRQQERGQLSTHLTSLAQTQKDLEAETRRLVQALRAPQVRGRWGEIQLRRVVELAGMEEHCDFEVQQTLEGDQAALRPDLIVTVPGGRSIVVDAKAPVMAYLEAVEASEAEVREARLRDHAGQVRAHVTKLSGKAYWEHLPLTPDFVVLFLPGEAFFSAALQHDPTLLEYGVERRVFLAGPLTLLALLRTVAYGWTQEKLAAHAQDISDLGKDLYERLCTMFDHLGELQRRLDGAVQAHNAAIGSLESRVLPAARRFKDLGIRSAKEMAEPGPVDHQPRMLQAPEAATALGVGAVDGELLPASGPGEDMAPTRD